MVAGVDNGLDGGIVRLDHNGRVLKKWVMPVVGRKGDGKRQYDIPAMVAIARELDDPQLRDQVFIERAQAMPGQGVSSMFSIGYGFGIWQGILTAVGVPFEIVSPQVWQKVIFSGMSAKTPKKESYLVAARLVPEESWLATEKSRVPHDGLTDAFCIAEYGRRRRAVGL